MSRCVKRRSVRERERNRSRHGCQVGYGNVAVQGCQVGNGNLAVQGCQIACMFRYNLTLFPFIASGWLGISLRNDTSADMTKV